MFVLKHYRTEKDRDISTKKGQQSATNSKEALVSVQLYWSINNTFAATSGHAAHNQAHRRTGVAVADAHRAL